MLPDILRVFDTFWHIIQYCWEGLKWFFQFEEMWALQFDKWYLPEWQQLLILSPFNVVMIAVEVLFFSLFIKGKKNKEHKTPRVLLFISRGKPFGYIEWALTGLIPHCQKFGAFLLAKQLKNFGWKMYLLSIKRHWRKYLALCVGGTCRLAIMVYIPKEYLNPLISGMVIIRLVTWWFENNHNKASVEEIKEEI